MALASILPPIDLLVEHNCRLYNLERSHQGYRLKDKTPVQALRVALANSELPDGVMGISFQP